MSRKHIIVVDDEIDTLSMMKFILSTRNYRVSTANSGKKALKMFLEKKDSSAQYDLLITDIQMPGMRGDQLIEELQRNDITVPVVAITGFGDKELVVELLRNGCDEYIDKPINAEDLEKRIQRLFHRQEVKIKHLQQIKKMAEVGTYVGEIAHDLNNMLCAAIGYTDIAQSKLEPDDKLSGEIAQIHEASCRAAKLNQHLLALTRKQTHNFTFLNISDKVTKILEVIKPVIGKKITVETNIADDTCSIYAEEEDIDQIVMNLVVNARDAMPKGGKLIIKTESVAIDRKDERKLPDVKQGEFICLSITDNGTGMSQETIDQIFKPFYTTKSKGKGTGLGLATVCRIVKEYKGWIDVISKPGCGSTFSIYLPVFPVESIDDTSRSETEISERVAFSHTSKSKVVVHSNK